MATIADVAQRARVSPVTVSRVINNSSYVKAATRERVEQAIRDLRFHPSQAARSLRSRKTHTIALILPDITNPFWTTIARGVEDTAMENGYAVVLGNMDEKPEKQSRYLESLLRQRPDGVIIAPASDNRADLELLLHSNVPFVMLDREVEGLEGDVILGDSFDGAVQLTRFFLKRGKQDIVFISGQKTTSTAMERVLGGLFTLRQAGLDVDRNKVLWGDYKSSSGYELAGTYLDKHCRPEVFIGANNAIVLGIQRCLKERGIRVPEDCELAGFDDLGEFNSLFNAITLAIQPAYEIGKAAAKRLLEKTTKGSAGTKQIFPMQVIHYSNEPGDNSLEVKLEKRSPLDKEDWELLDEIKRLLA